MAGNGSGRLEPLDEQARERHRQEAENAREEFLETASGNGYCVPCWDHATDSGRFPRLGVRVRHRNPANCPQARRQQKTAAQ